MVFIETAEWIELIFGVESTAGLSYTVLWGNSGISKNNGSSLWNTVSQALVLEKFRHGTSTVAGASRQA